MMGEVQGVAADPSARLSDRDNNLDLYRDPAGQ
jgi:hypothetical protein